MMESRESREGREGREGMRARVDVVDNGLCCQLQMEEMHHKLYLQLKTETAGVENKCYCLQLFCSESVG